MNISYLEISLKSSIFQLSYQLHNSLVDRARKLFKPLKDSASPRVCNEKEILVLSFRFFVSDIISKVGFWPFLATGT